MMAMRRSLGAFLKRSSEKAAMYCTDSAPKELPGAWGRNVYWRFRSLNTASEMAVVIHRNFFCRSTRSAIGTACALE